MQRAAYVSAKDFVDRVMVAGRFELYTSELATRYARSAAVKRFAQQMIAESRETEEEFASTLEKAAIEPPIDAMDIAYSAKYFPLPAFGQTDDFDDSYVLQQVEVHEDAVSLFSDYAARGQAPELQAFAARLLPRLEERAAHGAGADDAAMKGAAEPIRPARPQAPAARGR